MNTDKPFKSEEEVNQWYSNAVDGLGKLLVLEATTEGEVIDPSYYLHTLGFLRERAERAYRLLGIEKKFEGTKFNSFAETHLNSKPCQMAF